MSQSHFAYWKIRYHKHHCWSMENTFLLIFRMQAIREPNAYLESSIPLSIMGKNLRVKWNKSSNCVSTYCTSIDVLALTILLYQSLSLLRSVSVYCILYHVFIFVSLIPVVSLLSLVIWKRFCVISSTPIPSFCFNFIKFARNR